MNITILTIILVTLLLIGVVVVATLLYKTNRQIEFEDDMRFAIENIAKVVAKAKNATFHSAVSTKEIRELLEKGEIDEKRLVSKINKEAYVTTLMKAREAHSLAVETLEGVKEEIASTVRILTRSGSTDRDYLEEKLRYLLRQEKEAEKRVYKELEKLDKLTSISETETDFESMMEEANVPFFEWENETSNEISEEEFEDIETEVEDDIEPTEETDSGEAPEVKGTEVSETEEESATSDTEDPEDTPKGLPESVVIIKE